jgi:hypothetical protein
MTGLADHVRHGLATTWCASKQLKQTVREQALHTTWLLNNCVIGR